MAAHSNVKLNCEPVSVVVTSNHDNNGSNNSESVVENCNNVSSIQRPDHLLFLDPNQTQNDSLLLCTSPTANGANYIGERRGSKSCLRVSSNYGDDSGSHTPTRRRSVHFDASPAATVEIPSSDADKVQRGCGALIGPAPFLGGKEVYVHAPPPPSSGSGQTEDEDANSNDDDDDEESQRLLLAKAIARRQSGSSGPAVSICGTASISVSAPGQHQLNRGGSRNRLLSPPPPPIQDDVNETDLEEDDQPFGGNSSAIKFIDGSTT